MNSGERVKRAIHFEGPDRIPIRYEYVPAVLYEHGNKLVELCKKYPQDFGGSDFSIPSPDPKAIQADGSYYSITKDAWGVEWENRAFGITGHPLNRPLDDITNLKDFKAPDVPEIDDEQFKNDKINVDAHKEKYYCLRGWVNIFETMHAVRKFEDVLIDLHENTSEINELADMITDYDLKLVKYMTALGVDGIMYADDWGSQYSHLIGKDLWRYFFKPRYERVMKPAKDAGIDIFFHSCGYCLDLIEEFAKLGVNVLEPQLAVNDKVILAEKCRKYKICVEVKMDTQHLMPFGSAEDVEKAIKEASEYFGGGEGGIIWFGEINNGGVPFRNMDVLYKAFYTYGKSLFESR